MCIINLLRSAVGCNSQEETCAQRIERIKKRVKAFAGLDFVVKYVLEVFEHFHISYTRFGWNRENSRYMRGDFYYTSTKYFHVSGRSVKELILKALDLYQREICKED